MNITITLDKLVCLPMGAVLPSGEFRKHLEKHFNISMKLPRLKRLLFSHDVTVMPSHRFWVCDFYCLLL